MYNHSNLHSNVATHKDTDFINKVFFYFGLEILFSFFGVYYALNHLLGILLANQVLFFGLIIIEFAIILTARKWIESHPLNLILFFLFPFITGITITPLIAMAMATLGMGVIVKALLATATTFFAAALFGMTTKKNLASLAGIAFMILIGMIVIGIIGFFLPWGSTFEMFYSGLGIAVFTIFAAYDVQKIKSYPSNMYMLAAMSLFLDIFNLFIMILRFILAINRR